MKKNDNVLNNNMRCFEMLFDSGRDRRTGVKQ